MEKNCKVMMFEDLVRSPNKFIENIVKFTGEKKALKHDMTPKKPAPSNLYNELLRYINILSRIINFLVLIPFIEKYAVIMKAYQARDLEVLYKVGNNIR